MIPKHKSTYGYISDTFTHLPSSKPAAYLIKLFFSFMSGKKIVQKIFMQNRERSTTLLIQCSDLHEHKINHKNLGLDKWHI